MEYKEKLRAEDRIAMGDMIRQAEARILQNTQLMYSLSMQGQKHYQDLISADEALIKELTSELEDPQTTYLEFE